MSVFKAKMHQILFSLRFQPEPRWGAYSTPHSPDLQLYLRGPLLREGGENGRGGERTVREKERMGG